MVWHIPENELAGTPYLITVTTPGAASGARSTVVTGWPAGWTVFPKIVSAIRSGTLLGNLEVTGHSSGTLTISGVIDGYTDFALLAGDTLELRPSKLALTELQTATDLKAPLAGPTFTGKVQMTASTTDYFLQVDTFGFQSFGTVNNAWVADNLYWDGSGWKYKANGYGCITYFLAGGWQVLTSPNNSSGAAAAATPVAALSVGANGLVTIAATETTPIKIGAVPGVTSYSGIWFAQSSPNTNNGALIATNDGHLYINSATGNVHLRSNNSTIFVANNLHVGIGYEIAFDLTSAVTVGNFTGTTKNALTILLMASQSAPAVRFKATSSTSTLRDVGYLDVGFTVSTDASRTGYISLSAVDYNGTREGLRIAANGSVADVIIPIANIRAAADDAAAAALSPTVPVGGLYRTGSAIKIRVS